MAFVAPTVLKPGQRLPSDAAPPPPGVCIDGANGYIHIYKNLTDAVQITLTFEDAGLRWPANAGVAVQAAPDNSPTFGQWPFPVYPQVSPDQQTLTVTLPAKGPGHNYRYLLQYLDSQNKLWPAEPIIINH
jgi:hypothetical protein